MPEFPTSFPLSREEQDRFVQHLKDGNYLPHTVPHAKAAAKGDRLNLVLYNSGKLVVQGKAREDWIHFHLEPEILQRVISTDQESDRAESSSFTAHIGIDESGKGDYFGPLVIAAAYIEPSMAQAFADLGIRDSKRITSDKKIRKIAAELRKLSGFASEEIVLMPETYNNLMEKMGSVNRVLAWGHAKTLEQLLERKPACPRAVADQFGPEHQIRNALQKRGKAIELEQRHKAESDPAVAAASILARDRFIRAMEELGAKVKQELPKGATTVRPVAEDLVRRWGPRILDHTVKKHFRTTKQVLSAVNND